MKIIPRRGLLLTIAFSYQALAGTIAESFEKLPIVYHKKYNFSSGGLVDKILASLHPFDPQKYRTIAQIIQKNLHFSPEQFFQPTMVSDKELLLVHTPHYLSTLKKSSTISEIIDMGMLLSWVPNAWFQKRLLTPMRYAVGGTILGAQLALEYGWAFNLAGGFHHAKANSGEGGCVFADIPLAIYTIWQHNPNLKVMIIDLDAHQGNGIESVLQHETQRVYIFDMFNKNVEHTDSTLLASPHVYSIALDGGRLSAERYGIPMPDIFERCVDRRIDAQNYLKVLKDNFPKALSACIQYFGGNPDLIIYNAGTDIHANDSWGCLDVASNGIYERDSYIFQQAVERNIPILMTPAGGYFKESGHVIGNSIVNIINNIIKPSLVSHRTQ